MNIVAALLATSSVFALSVAILLGAGETIAQSVIFGAAGTATLVALAFKERATFEQMCRASARSLASGALVLIGLLLAMLAIDGAISGASPFNPDHWGHLVAKSGAFGFVATAFVAYSSLAALLASLVYRSTLWLLALAVPQSPTDSPASEA